MIINNLRIKTSYIKITTLHKCLQIRGFAASLLKIGNSYFLFSKMTQDHCLKKQRGPRNSKAICSKDHIMYPIILLVFSIPFYFISIYIRNPNALPKLNEKIMRMSCYLGMSSFKQRDLEFIGCHCQNKPLFSYGLFKA